MASAIDWLACASSALKQQRGWLCGVADARIGVAGHEVLTLGELRVSFVLAHVGWMA